MNRILLPQKVSVTGVDLSLKYFVLNCAEMNQGNWQRALILLFTVKQKKKQEPFFEAHVQAVEPTAVIVS